MLRNCVKLFLIALSLAWSSCDSLHEKLPLCEIALEFRYDYNMGYADQFRSDVKNVDIFVFDEQGKYLFTQQANAEDLIDGNRMSINENLPFGNFKILTVAGLSDRIDVKSLTGGLTPGQTDLQDVRIALKRASNEYADEIPGLWVGQVVDVNYTEDMGEAKVVPVNLVKDSNRFNFTLVRKGSTEPPYGGSSPVPFTFEIIAPDGAVYDYNNDPQLREQIVYKPYDLNYGTETGSVAAGSISTLRLFANDPDGYTLNVRNTQNGQILASYDLMQLLNERKPSSGPDGRPLSLQEYLDRESEWDIVIVHDIDDGGSFVIFIIQVNGWICWQHGMDT